MSALQKLLLTIALVLTGLLAGLQTLMLIGVLPAMARMPLLTYAGMWQSMDYFMAARMPIFANGTLVFYLIAIACFARSSQKWIFRALIGSCTLLILDTVFTVKQQLPVNHALQSIDLTQSPDLVRLQALRDATITHFHLRGFLSVSAFFLLAFAVVFSFSGPADHPMKGSQE